MTLETMLELQRQRVREDSYHARRKYRTVPEMRLPDEEYRDSPHVTNSPYLVRHTYHQNRQT